MISIEILILLLYFISKSHEQVVVTVTPTGPLYIAINTERTITCSISGGRFTGWIVIFRSGATEDGIDDGEIVRGINIRSSIATSSSMIVNTTDTSIIGLECTGASSLKQNRTRINLTIYGIPSPQNLSIQGDGNITTASWNYQRIETVNVSFNLSLTFFETSKLQTLTTEVTDLQSYNFTLDSVRSCDYFIFCISGRNMAGQGNKSCTSGSFPYILQADMIKYSLTRTSETFSLNVTVLMLAACRLNIHNSFYVLEVIGVLNETIRSDQVSVNTMSHLQINELLENTLYKFRIISKNSIGEASSSLLEFFTSDVQGVNICPTDKEGAYNISCNYVRGGKFTGCGYCLTGGTNLTPIKGNITETTSNMHEISNIMEYDYIMVNSSDGMIIKNESFDVSTYSISCTSTTEPTDASNTTDNTTTSNSVVPTAVILAIVLVLLAFLVLLVAAAAVAIFLYRHGYSCQLNSKGGKISKAGSSTDSRACLENAAQCQQNPSYGVANNSASHKEILQCSSNPAYEVIKAGGRNIHGEDRIPYYDVVQLPLTPSSNN